MKIFIDIGHPAHVHYFRTFITLMQAKGHTFFITARDKEVVFNLLDYYKLEYKSRGKGQDGVFGKLFYILKADRILFKFAKQFRPDLFLSFGSPYAAQVSFLMQKPHIAFDDTDHAFFSHLMYVPFTKTIVTPQFYLKNYGDKHIRFNSFMEMCSLLPKYFIEDKKVISNSGIKEGDRFVILRFVSWKASHDIGHKGLSANQKIELVNQLKNYGNVIISSEGEVPDELRQYVFSAHPAEMHQYLKNASLIVSESLTMAAEAAFLGTPVICVSTAIAGTLNEEVKLGLIELYQNPNGVSERAIELFKDTNYKENFSNKVKRVLADLIDPTAFMVWFIENYPESVKIMRENHDYQYNYK